MVRSGLRSAVPLSVSLSRPPSISAIDPAVRTRSLSRHEPASRTSLAADEPHSAVWWAIALIEPRANCKDRLMSLRIALHKRLSGGFAALVAFAVALAPFESASAQQGKG